MDLSVLIQHLQAAIGPILWTFALFAIGDDALDLLIWIRTQQENKRKIAFDALLVVLANDVGTRAFGAVFVAGLLGAFAAGDDPIHAGLAAAAVAAGISTVAVKKDFTSKLAEAFPHLVGTLIKL